MNSGNGRAWMELPNHPDYERAVLGTMLAGGASAVELLRDVVGPDAMYATAHRRIFEAILEVAGSGGHVEPITAAEALERAGHLESVGGVGALVAMRADDFSPSGGLSYAAVVRDDYHRRVLIHRGEQLRSMAFSPIVSLDDALDFASGAGKDIEATEAELVPVGRLAHEVHQATQRAAADPDSTYGIRIGHLPKLNRLLHGLQREDLVLVCARPSAGKTAFGIALALGVDVPVLFESKEMAGLQIGYRAVANVADVDSYALRAGRQWVDSMETFRSISDAEWSRLRRATMEDLRDRPVYVDDRCFGIDDVAAATRRAVRDHGVQLVIVDYLQLLNPSAGARSGNREQEVSGIGAALKELAKRHGIVVVAMCQLNRTVDFRDDKRPRLSDLRESGALEQHADVVLGLYRPGAYDADADQVAAEIGILKHRNGVTGMVNALFRLPTGRWEEERR